MRFIISAIVAAFALFQTFNNSGLTGGAFAQLAIGGGGFVTRQTIASDGTQLARTDTGGAFARSSYTAKWTPVLTAYSMPSADNYLGNQYGVCEVAIAPSNTSHFYMYYAPNGAPPTASYIYSSTNKGSTWARVGAATFPTTDVCPANDQGGPSYRLSGPYMDVSPANENVVYVGTHASGVYYSLNGGSTWTQISTATIPAGGSAGDTNQGNLIAFDPSDATGNTVYITSYSNGVWKCTSALTSPSCTKLSSTGMPTTFKWEYVDQVGTLWIVDNTATPQLLRYLSGTWSTQLTGINNGVTSVTSDPANSSYVVASIASGCIYYSNNAQAGTPTWTGSAVNPSCFNGGVTSTTIPWQQWAADSFLSLNGLTFDPTQSHQLYGANGDGVYKTTAPTSGTSVTWNANETAGIENLDLQASSIPLGGGGIGFAAQDRPAWNMASLNAYPSQYYPNNSTIIRFGTSVCGNPTANTYGNLNNSNGLSVSSTGYGGTYTTSGTSGLPGGFGAGQCVMLTSSNWVWMGSVSSVLQPYFTNNSGASWTACTFGGGKTASGGGWVTMAQDSAGNVVLYNDGTGATNGAGAAGSWESSSSTACAFTQNSTTKPTTNLTLLLPVPGHSCNFVLASLAYIWGGLPGTGNAYLTQNCGVSWSAAISGMNSIVSLGIGPAQAGHDGYTSLYYQGWYNNGTTNAFGVWEVDNIDATPVFTDLDSSHSGTQKGYPCGNMDFVEFIQADAVTAGTVAFGFADSGGCYRTN